MHTLKYVAIGCAGLLLVAAVGIWWFLQNLVAAAVEADAEQYVTVPAQVVSVEPACKVASDWRSVGGRDRSLRPWQRSEAMPCPVAREAVARGAEASDARVIPVQQIVYRYVSPVDERPHEGRLDIERWYDEGGVIPISQNGMVVAHWSVDPGDPRPGPTELDPSNPRPGTNFRVDADTSRADLSRWHQPDPFE
jgi:hypothetical protein